MELANTIVLRPEGHKGSDRRAFATLHPAAEELTTLAEAKSIDGGCGRDDGIRGDVLAKLINLGVDVAPECGALVGVRIGALSNDVDESAWVNGFGKSGNGLDAFISVRISETCDEDG